MSINFISYKGGYKYQLMEPYCCETGITLMYPRSAAFIRLHAQGKLVILKGYAWDGPSGPAIDTKNFMRGSVVHDALYQLMRQGILDAKTFRDHADQLLRKMCREDGMSAIRAWWVYKSVKYFASSAASPSHRRPVLTAP